MKIKFKSYEFGKLNLDCHTIVPACIWIILLCIIYIKCFLCEHEQHMYFCTHKNLMSFINISVFQWLTNVFFKGPHCKYFKLCGSRVKIKGIAYVHL